MSSWSDLLMLVEKLMVDRGWAPVVTRRGARGPSSGPPWPEEVEARRADAELSATVGGQPFGVLCLAPTEGPCFLRFGWGDPRTPPEMWAVVDGVAVDAATARAPRQMTAFQVVGGATQLQLGVGFWTSHDEAPHAERIVGRAFEVFDELLEVQLASGSPGFAALEPVVDRLRAPAAPAPPPSKLTAPLGWGLLAATAAGTTAAFLSGVEAGLTVGLTFVPFGLLGAAMALHHHLGSSAGARRLARKIERAVRACGLLDVREPVGSRAPSNPVVILGAGSGSRMLGTATFLSGTSVARSSKHGLALAVTYQALSAPNEIEPLCRLVPSTSAVVELTGPEAIVARLRPRPLEQRQTGVLRIALDVQALERGGLEELLTELVEVADAGASGPYR